MTNAPPSHTPRPGGALAARPLHFFWVCDCSGSMDGQKIQTLNFAINDCVAPMAKVASENPNAQVLVRAVRFADGAQWHVAAPTPISQFQWQPLSADGLTSMGAALHLVAEQLRSPPMPDRALQPVIVLLSDGQPTDDFDAGLKALLDQPWGKRALRIAIAIGADASKDTLQRFIAHKEIKVFEANNAPSLVHYIRWSSTVALKAASAIQTGVGATGTVLAGPLPPTPAAPPDPDDVW